MQTPGILHVHEQFLLLKRASWQSRALPDNGIKAGTLGLLLSRKEHLCAQGLHPAGWML